MNLMLKEDYHKEFKEGGKSSSSLKTFLTMMTRYLILISCKNLTILILKPYLRSIPLSHGLIEYYPAENNMINLK